MEYLQYYSLLIRDIERMSKVLNLIINGIPSIQSIRATGNDVSWSEF